MVILIFCSLKCVGEAYEGIDNKIKQFATLPFFLMSCAQHEKTMAVSLLCLLAKFTVRCI